MNGIPQYKQLYEILRKHIEEGVYQEGDLLPSENDLCKTHHVTRPTVRHALDALVNDGYITKQQGKGSIVHGLPQGIGILSVSGTTSAIGKERLKTDIIVKPTVRNWDKHFMFHLSEAEKESGCIYIERLRWFEADPIFYDINYLPNINLPRFTSRNLENKSLFDVLRQNYGIEIKGGEQRLRSIPASGDVSRHLHISEGHPVLHLERKIATNRLNYFVYSSIYCNTEKHAIYGTF
jgi:GntR family transcriptional regulator/GntR family frlABCD operon transcriptional regulator